jgi:GntP family gluconate:H+ symporter
MPLATPPVFDEREKLPHEHAVLPGLFMSLLPIVLPVLLIAGHAVAMQVDPKGFADGNLAWLAVAGNPNMALMLSAALALLTYVLRRRPSKSDLSAMVEESLLSAGVIVLITSAGGAFGAMLKEANVGGAVQAIFSGEQRAAGMALLFLAFAMASMIKLSQGSTTVAMITASGMMNAMIADESLGYHRVYLATAIGCGAMVAAWMNDSGFWVFCRMGGLSESEGLRAWTPLTSIMGFAGLAATAAMAMIWPLV